MSAIRETAGETLERAASGGVRSAGFVDRALGLLSSVRFGVVLLMFLVLACMAGMLVMQINMEGFDKYFAELTPSQRLLYSALGLFDIYHTWYFNALLLVLSLNIVLSSIDTFPRAWGLVARRKLDASAQWLRGQEQSAVITLEGETAEEVAGRVSAACRSVGLRPRVSEKDGRTFVFAERGAWNRLGAYAVHVALLVIFAGGFLTAQLGHTGQMLLTPGGSASEMTETTFGEGGVPSELKVALPFEVECTDIRQQLLDKDGPISPMNTLNWSTAVRIKDAERGETEALVRLNAPYDYRGYRFFQSSFVSEGKARQITLSVEPEEGGEAQELIVMRDGSAALADGTTLQFIHFFPDFAMQGARVGTASEEYRNPAAAVRVVKPSGETALGYAFGERAAAAGPLAGRAVGGYKLRLVDFEKVGASHILSVQKDPGAGVVYVGFVLLTVTLLGVFFFSHQRVWALVEGRGGREFEITFGGNTNRSRLAFEQRFARVVRAAGGVGASGVKQS